MGPKEKCEMNIQAFVRIRPFTSTEKQFRVLESNVKDIIVKGQPDRQPKTFSFDRVFAPETKQDTVYNTVVKPMVAEVLAGYNCTVFAYGQTGSGKTFTMMGEGDLNGSNDDKAGVIPRALDDIFDELKQTTNEYFVKVSFVELYNEELIDLLNISTDKNKIRIFEDPTKKGSVIVTGVTDMSVMSKEEAFKLIHKGISRRHTASTLINEQSSRSHSLFTITVHVKDNESDEGEDYIKMAKLNLVDLAGSENIGRSGAVDKRFREASNINTSLLTLGRVITALVEKAPHVPYRESKLTRLLQDSLGGHTKTSIIATVSPSASNLEETLSTLDYACRAKFITNKPEINKKIAAKCLLKECMEEIERLKRDLQACRDKTGIYIAQENYENMMRTLNDHHKIVEEKEKVTEDLKNAIFNKEEMLSALNISYNEKCSELTKAKCALLEIEAVVKETKLELRKAQAKVEEQEYLVKKYDETEKKLSAQAMELKTVASIASSDTHKLHDKIERSRSIEKFNKEKLEEFSSNLTNKLLNYQEETDNFVSVNLEFNKNQKEKLSSGYDEQVDYVVSIHDGLSQVTTRVNNTVHVIIDNCSEMSHDVSSFIDKQTDLTSEISHSISEVLATFYSDIIHPHLFRMEENFMDLENMLKQLGDEHKKVNKKLTTAIEENVRLKEKLENVDSVVSNFISVVAEKIKIAEEGRCLALSEKVKQNDKLEQCKTEIMNTLENINTCVNNDSAYNIIENQKKLLHECECAAVVTNKQHEQLFSDILCKNKEITTALIENSDALKKAEDEFTSQANSTVSSTFSARQKVNLECKELINKELQSFENFEHVILDSQLQLTNSIHSKIQNLSDKSKHLNETAEESVKKISKSMEDNLIQYTAYLQREGEEFLNAEKQMNRWKESASCTLQDGMNLINRFLTKDVKHDIPTGDTPKRKNYDFPTELVATSPAEQIIQRFRKNRPHLFSKEHKVLNQVNTGNITPTKGNQQRKTSKEQSSFPSSEVNNELNHLPNDVICEEDKENLLSKQKTEYPETSELKRIKTRYAFSKRN